MRSAAAQPARARCHPFGTSRPRARARLAAPRSSSSSSSSSSPPEQQQQQQPQQQASGSPALNEDMLAQLRAAQEEAARLKRELAEMQAQQGAPKGDVIDSKPKRIDSTDNRETLWGTGKRSAWLTEADVEFFTGGGATESSETAGPSPEAQQAIGRRLAVGAVAAAALGAFALVPTRDLRLKPSKPLFFYVTQLLQAQAQLAECGPVIDGAQWDTLRLVLPRIRGSPTNAEDALFSVVALLPPAAAAQAEPLAGEFLEYLDAVDYNKYFDAMPTRTPSGGEAAEFVKFSSAALKAAQGKLAAFLALIPEPDLEAARRQLDAQGAVSLQ